MSGIQLQARVDELTRQMRDATMLIAELAKAQTDLRERIAILENRPKPGRPRLVSNG